MAPGPVCRLDDPRPEACARLVSVERRRRLVFARVAFTPFRYRARSGRLELVETAAIRIAWERSAAGEARVADAIPDDFASGLFHDPARAREWYPLSPGGKGLAAGSDYVIVTTNAVRAGSSRLAAFISHKTRRGHGVAVVTETQWGSQVGQAPNHKPEKIRKWLQDNYIPLGIEYVLLIGDPYPDWSESVQGDVPMKLCWPWVRYPEWGMDVAPTDYYYADLTGNWDLNGNGYYGEYYDDTQPGGVDITPEVLVGRIPVYGGDYAALDMILDKIIRYESESDISRRRSALLPMSFLAEGYDQAALAEQMKADYFLARGFSLWRMYQQGSGPCGADSIYPGDQELRGGTLVRDRWAALVPGVVCWAGHGESDSVLVGYGGCWDGTLLEASDCPALDDCRPAFTYQNSCQTGHPEYGGNLQYSLLRRGAVGTVAATRDTWGDAYRDTYGNFAGSPTASGIGYSYLNRLSAGQAAGEALGLTKQAMSEAYDQYMWLMNLYDFNLLGDPASGLFSTGVPPGLSVSGDFSGDGTAQAAVFRPAAGLWSVRGWSKFYFGGESDCPVPGDYGAGAEAEAAVFRPGLGLWRLRGVSRFYFGGASDRPVPGDYRGIGKTLPAVFRSGFALWAIRGFTRIYFGAGSDLPVPGDYNGDGTGEAAVFRPSSGLWAARGLSRFYFGSGTDLPVPGDYDGDGTWEPAVFRPVGGLWAIRGLTRRYFGGNLDTPVPADYDGDGTDEAGIFRDSTGLWSARALTRFYFGKLGDFPVTR